MHQEQEKKQQPHYITTEQEKLCLPKRVIYSVTRGISRHFLLSFGNNAAVVPYIDKLVPHSKISNGKKKRTMQNSRHGRVCLRWAQAAKVLLLSPVAPAVLWLYLCLSPLAVYGVHSFGTVSVDKRRERNALQIEQVDTNFLSSRTLFHADTAPFFGERAAHIADLLLCVLFAFILCIPVFRKL